jgi:outer membrane protein TolC
LLLAVVTRADPAWAVADAGTVTFTLDGLLQTARQNDGRVREAEADLKILRGKYDEARWSWFPKMEMTLMLAGPTPEARNDGLGGPPTTEASKLYDLNIGAPGIMMGAEIQGVLPVYTFGKLQALEDLARHGVEVGVGLHERAQAEAEVQAAQAFWAYQLARQGKASLKDTLDRLEQAKTTLKRLREQKSEQVTQMDVYKLDFYRGQVDARLAFADSGAALSVAAVRLIAAVPPAVRVALAAEDLPEPRDVLKPAEEYIALAAEHRPELRAITAGIAAREREVFIRQRMFLPDFGIGAYARWKWTTSATRQLSPFAYDPYNELSLGLALLGHYSFDVPQKMAQLEQARGELEKLERQKELLGGAIRLEIEKAHSELRDALARAEGQATAERNARRWATAAYAAFDLGTTDTRELVDSLTALGVASGERLRAWYDVQVGLRTLARATGSASVIPVTAAPAPPSGVPVP